MLARPVVKYSRQPSGDSQLGVSYDGELSSGTSSAPANGLSTSARVARQMSPSGLARADAQ
ncbi:MAG: hypothetical protein R2939_19875 [Kofleriaceae bacterium]